MFCSLSALHYVPGIDDRQSLNHVMKHFFECMTHWTVIWCRGETKGDKNDVQERFPGEIKVEMLLSQYIEDIWATMKLKYDKLT